MIKLLSSGATALVLVLSFCPFTSSQEITIPAEYLLGRWYSGHTFDTYQLWSDTSSPQEYLAYRYSSPTLQFGLDDIKRYLITDSDADNYRTPSLSFGIRTGGRIELGIDSLYVDRRAWEPNYTHSSDQFYRKERIHKLSSHFAYVNRELVRLGPSWTRYDYLIEHIPDQGEIFIRSKLSISGESTDEWSETGDTRRFTGSYDRSERELRSDSEVRFGINRSLAVGLDCKLQDRSINVGAVGIDQSSWTYENLTIYSLKSVAMTIGPRLWFSLRPGVVIYAGYNQDLRSYDDINFFDYPDITPYSVHQEESDLKAVRGSIETELRIISKGSFNSTIVLDDYRNYYGHMLFAGQKMATVGYSYSREDHEFYNSHENRVWLSAGIGLGNFVDLRQSVEYRLLDDPFSDMEEINLASNIILKPIPISPEVVRDGAEMIISMLRTG